MPQHHTGLTHYYTLQPHGQMAISCHLLMSPECIDTRSIHAGCNYTGREGYTVCTHVRALPQGESLNMHTVHVLPCLHRSQTDAGLYMHTLWTQGLTVLGSQTLCPKRAHFHKYTAGHIPTHWHRTPSHFRFATVVTLNLTPFAALLIGSYPRAAWGSVWV